MWVRWSDTGLSALGLTGPVEAGHYAEAEESEVPREVRELLRAYFRGERTQFDSLAIDFRGTDFQQRVWEALRRIPWGSVCSYGDIAKAIGKPGAVRAVGLANGANPLPIVVPCHRVVRSGMAIGGFSAGLDCKRRLLALEHISVRDDRVFVSQHEMFDAV